MAFLRNFPRTFFTILLTLIITSCSSIQLDNSYLPDSKSSETKLVVSGMLLADTPLRNIFIGKTLPLYSETAIRDYSVFDAEAIIIVDGTELKMTLQQDSTKPLELVGKPMDYSFYEVPGMIVQSGKRYQIKVTWHTTSQNSLAAQAFTDVPASVPNLDSISIERMPGKSVILNSFIQVNHTNQAFVFATRGQKLRSPQWGAQGSFIGLPTVPNGINHFTKLSSKIEVSPFTPQFFDFIDSTGKSPLYPSFGRLYVYDKIYAQYFRSGLMSLQSNSNPFSSGNIDNIQGNISGNGVGIFCGLKIGAEVKVLNR